MGFFSELVKNLAGVGADKGTEGLVNVIRSWSTALS